MKYTNTQVAANKTILANDHYVAIPYNCASLTTLATNGVIPAGTIIPANDATAIGVLLSDVTLADDPNGAVVVHGFVKKGKLPAAPAATVDIPMIKFVD